MITMTSQTGMPLATTVWANAVFAPFETASVGPPELGTVLMAKAAGAEKTNPNMAQPNAAANLARYGMREKNLIADSFARVIAFRGSVCAGADWLGIRRFTDTQTDTTRRNVVL